MAVITDETLYRRFLGGHEIALRELIARYGNHLTFYINGYIHDIHDAEDLMIEAFAYIAAKRPAIRDGGFKAYLYVSARHLALRFAGKARRRVCFGFEDLTGEPEGAELTEAVVNTAERNRILRLCMEQLNPDYREALYLMYFEGMCQSDIAAVMHKSQKQIANLTYRGKKSLHGLLLKEGITNAND